MLKGLATALTVKDNMSYNWKTGLPCSTQVIQISDV